MKYKVGDRVRIVSEWGKGCYEGPDGKMDKWLGKVMTVRCVGNFLYRMVEDAKDNERGGWVWTENCIAGLACELLNEEKKQMKKCEMKLSAWLKARKNGCEAIDKLRTELENTKKERDTYRERCDDIGEERDAVIRDYIEYRAKVDKSFETLAKQKRLFPVGIGDVVYDITLKDKEGKFTTEKPCLETSAVKPVKVTEGNFFDIIRRIEKKDVFFDEERAKKHVRKLCEGKK